MRMTLGKKMYIGFGAVLALLILMAGIGSYEITNTRNTYEELLNNGVHNIDRIKDIITISTETQLAAYGYLLQGNQENLNDYQETINEFEQVKVELSDALTDEKGTLLLNELADINKQYIKVADEAIFLKDKNNPTYVSLLTDKGHPIVQAFKNKAEEMIAYQTDELDVVRNETRNQVDTLIQTVFIISIIALLVGIAIATVISRMIAKPIKNMASLAEKIASGDLQEDVIKIKSRDEVGDLARAFNHMTQNLKDVINQINHGAEQVASASEELQATSEQATTATEQISSAIQEVASGSEMQVSSSEKSATAMEDVSIGIQRIAMSASTAKDSAEDATKRSEQGYQSLQEAIAQMDSIEAGTQNTTVAIKKLNDRSKEISKIIDVITDIAEQTNLLSLNAAIEAARAGEHGKGFAVVADEVRKLAEQSRASANQIVTLIKEIQTDTETANEEMDGNIQEVYLGKEVIQKTGDAFQKVLQAVQQVHGQIQEVFDTTEQIAINTVEVSTSVEQLAQIAKEASEQSQTVAASSEEQLASMEEISSSSESLSKLALELQGLVGRFKI